MVGLQVVMLGAPTSLASIMVVGPHHVAVTHNAANEYLGLIERAENGPPRACANWTAPSSGQ